jgi:hypothetical protein
MLARCRPICRKPNNNPCIGALFATPRLHARRCYSFKGQRPARSGAYSSTTLPNAHQLRNVHHHANYDQNTSYYVIHRRSSALPRRCAIISNGPRYSMCSRSLMPNRNQPNSSRGGCIHIVEECMLHPDGVLSCYCKMATQAAPRECMFLRIKCMHAEIQVASPNGPIGVFLMIRMCTMVKRVKATNTANTTHS